MANEPNLHHLFSSAESPTQRIDVASVIRRSKARRLPKQIGAGGVFTLAIGGIGLAGIQGIVSLQSNSTSSAGAPAQPPGAVTDNSKGQEATSGDGLIKRAPAEKINLCGGMLAEVAPSQSGLLLTSTFPDAAAGSTAVEGTVTMTNTGSVPVSGYTAGSPAITLSRDGIVLWHSNGPTTMIAREISLAPGESAEYQASFAPVICSTEDDEGESFRSDLPPAPAGEYQVSAAIDLSSDGGVDLVTGPLDTVTLR
jgi:hypothetical protein